MSHSKTPDEIKKMIEGGRIAGEVLDLLIKAVRPGITTLALDKLAEEWIKARGGESAFKKVPGYHHTLCTSVNNQVVHAIPTEYILKPSDVITIDLGVYYQGLFTDTAWTVSVGEASQEVSQFLETGRKALVAGIGAAKSGNRVGDISSAIEKTLSAKKLGIVTSLTGHGVGEDLHEDPLIPNLGRAGTGAELKESMTIAIEPIYTDGDPEVFLENDEWTITAPKSRLAAVFEHTVVITEGSAKILTVNSQDL